MSNSQYRADKEPTVESTDTAAGTLRQRSEDESRLGSLVRGGRGGGWGTRSIISDLSRKAINWVSSFYKEQESNYVGKRKAPVRSTIFGSSYGDSCRGCSTGIAGGRIHEVRRRRVVLALRTVESARATEYVLSERGLHWKKIDSDSDVKTNAQSNRPLAQWRNHSWLSEFAITARKVFSFVGKERKGPNGLKRQAPVRGIQDTPVVLALRTVDSGLRESVLSERGLHWTEIDSKFKGSSQKSRSWSLAVKHEHHSALTLFISFTVALIVCYFAVIVSRTHLGS